MTQKQDNRAPFTMATEMEMEIQLQLDSNGRTTWIKEGQSINSEIASTNGKKVDDAAHQNIDYSTKSITTCLASTKDDQWMDDLLFDCEIADCGLMPRTFWMPADGTKPRCTLEQMALDVFHHHVPKDFPCDPSSSGAEWWVQLRPSPATGRYSMHDDEPDAMSKTGISFHWDKDEDLRILAGGSLHVHPHISTVTYLTDLGTATLVLNCRVNNETGEWITPENVDGFVSWPKQGKHLSFDGRFLHAAPPDLMEPHVFEQQCKIPESNDLTDRCRKNLERRHRRVTFLVNLWLNYRPFNVNPFPETLLDKLTKVDQAKWKNLFALGKERDKGKRVTVDDKEEEEDLPTRAFIWPMGDSDSREAIQVRMPLTAVRREASLSGNLQIHWRTSNKEGVCLSKNDMSLEQAETEDGDTKDESTNVMDTQSEAKRMKVQHDDGAAS